MSLRKYPFTARQIAQLRRGNAVSLTFSARLGKDGAPWVEGEVVECLEPWTVISEGLGEYANNYYAYEADYLESAPSIEWLDPTQHRMPDSAIRMRVTVKSVVNDGSKIFVEVTMATTS